MNMGKTEELKKLEEAIAADESLQLMESNLVFGEGNPDAKVLFIGEAPGERENELRRPFVGRAGQLLDVLIGELGWRRADVYITNIVKRRPPGNRDPLPEEIAAYQPYLARQIEILQPAVIAPLGRFSMNYFLPAAKITRDQGKLFRSGKYFVFPLLHPAAALRGTGAMNSLREAFKKLPAAVRKCEATDIITVPDAAGIQPQKKDGPILQSHFF
jgi:uracil-DNA glycosylase